MKDTTFKGRMISHTGEFMAALLLLQPMLDVLSYFMQNVGGTVFTTALRMALLITVSLYGFVISDRKRVYGVFYGLIAGFWLLHMLNCLRTGYMDPVGDAAEYLKLVQFPLWTLSFVTFFRRRDSLDYSVVGILAANFGIILLVVLLSFLTGHPVYTYDYPERG
ncbi:MAG: O-antigen ligase family protein, partial [Neglectibacter timonensis]